jgi:hypothetical protein
MFGVFSGLTFFGKLTFGQLTFWRLTISPSIDIETKWKWTYQDHVSVEIDGLDILLGNLLRASRQFFAFLLSEFFHFGFFFNKILTDTVLISSALSINGG